MVITKGIIVKGLAGLTAVGGAATTGGLLYKNGGRLWNVGGEDKFGIPRVCESNGCVISEEQLKKIKFKELEGSSGDLTVEGLVDKKIKFRMEKVSDKEYPNRKKYIFDNLSNSSDITIKGKAGEEEKELKIDKQSEFYFKESGDKLEKAGSKTKLVIEREKKMKEANGILEKVGLSELKLALEDLNDNNDGTKHKQKSHKFTKEEDLKKIQFKELGGGAASVEGLNNKQITVFFDWTTDSTNFPNNMKITLENTQVSQSIDLKDATGKKVLNVWVKTRTDKYNTFKVENGQLVRSSGTRR